MAQSTKTRKSTSTGKRSGSSRSSSNGRAKSSGTRAKSSGSRAKSSNGRAKSSNGRAKSSSASRTRSTAQSRNGSASFAETAMDKAKTTGHTVADAASKAKTPLIAGGTALAGVAAGALIKSLAGGNGKSRSPLKKLGRMKPAANIDLDTIKTVADRVTAYGQQASDIADAVEKTRKKN